jgi:autotransporter-associated beta strand protein
VSSNIDGYGAGSIVMSGPGTFQITGNNTYSGGTFLANGILQRAADVNLGDVNGGVTFNGGTLQTANNIDFAQTRSMIVSPLGGTFDTSEFNSLVSGNIQGSGQLFKQGIGSLALTGQSNATFFGDLIVNQGNLILNGSLGGNVIVNNSATLSGTGTLSGTATINSGGTASPGNNGVGILFIDNYIQEPGGILQIAIDPSGQSTILHATVSAVLNGILDVLPQPGNYSDGTVYTIFVAPGGLTGEFDTVESPFKNFRLIPSYFPTFVLLQAISILQVGTEPFSGNPGVVQRYLENIPTSFSSDLASVVNQLNTLPDPQIAQALDYFHPALFGGLTINTARNLASLNSMFFDPLRLCQPRCTRFWIAGRGNQMKEKSIQSGLPALLPSTDITLRGFNAATGGITLGADGTMEKLGLQVGISGGYDRSNLEWDQSAGSTKTNSWIVGAYALYGCEALRVGVAMTGSTYQNKSNRNIVFPGFFRTAKSKHQENAFSARIAAGYPVKILKDSNLFPYMVNDYFFVHQNGFGETGAQSLNLNVRRNDSQLVRSELGVGIEVPVNNKGMFFFKLGGTYWKTLSGSRFTANLEGVADTFTVINPSDSIFEIAPGIGFTYAIADKIYSSITYAGEFNSQYQVHDAKVLVNWCF